MADNYELETINVEGKTIRLTDKQLTDRFNAEVTNRENADTILDDKISAEVTNREQADTSLDNKISAEVTNRENADTSLDNKISAEVTNRENADTSLDNKINNIINTNTVSIENLRNVTALLVGDSYGTSWEPDGTSSKTWQTYLNETAKFKSYHEIGVGGIGLTTGTDTFQAQIETYAKTLTENDRLQYNLILVAGGANDILATANEIKNGATELKNICNNYFPNAVVVISCIAIGNIQLITDPTWNPKMTYNNLGQLRSNYRNACVLNGLKYIANGKYWCNENGSLSTDYVHPSAQGKQQIAYALLAGLQNYTYIGVTSLQTYDNIQTYLDSTDLPCILHCKNTGWLHITGTTNEYTTLCTIKSPAVAGAADYCLSVQGVIKLDDNKYAEGPVKIRYSSGVIKFNPDFLNSSGTDYLRANFTEIDLAEFYILLIK